MGKKKARKLAVFDYETDPFKYQEVPEPFAVGFYDGTIYWEYWGEDCTERFLEFLDTLDDEYIIYAHNGGKFDFFYLLNKGAIEQPIKIINGRIVKCRVGKHELRDSYAIIPIPLAAYQKDEIDYQWFRADVREIHRDDILHYLAKDCEYLFDLVSGFVAEFGTKLTVGSASITELMSFHPFPTTGETHDALFRQFYFGGRVQAFESGSVKGDWKVFDVNSMYPGVMVNSYHPIGGSSAYLHVLSNFDKHLDDKGFYRADPERPYFIRLTARNRGALCRRDPKTGGLDFTCTRGEFRTTSHELQIGLKYGIVEIEEIHELFVCEQKQKFDAFVNHYIGRKIDAKERGDKITELLTKLILNSSYGKTAQNPENFYDYKLQRPCVDPVPKFSEGWEPDTFHPMYTIWRRPSPVPRYYDVAIGASITGAARAVLLEALCLAERPVYCDTDSIICEGLPGARLHKSELGAWDTEAKGDTLYIGGKKLYALFDGDTLTKRASKGAKLDGAEIAQIALGDVLVWQSDAPNFKRDGSVKFISRKIQKNVANVSAFA